jgi:hypothetical protein
VHTVCEGNHGNTRGAENTLYGSIIKIAVKFILEDITEDSHEEYK